jgi:cytochrome c553
VGRGAQAVPRLLFRHLVFEMIIRRAARDKAARFFTTLKFWNYAIRNHARSRPGPSPGSATQAQSRAAHCGHCHPEQFTYPITKQNRKAMRPNSDRAMINFYGEETRPGVFRYFTMEPTRLAVILNPKPMREVSDKRDAAAIIAACARYHMERAWSPERMTELNEIIKNQKYAPSDMG